MSENVYPLDRRRDRGKPPAGPEADEAGLPAETGEDAESVLVVPSERGPAVDPPDPGNHLGVLTQERRPVVPGWMRSRTDAEVVLRWALRYGAHVTAYHATRLPKYAAKTAVWAPVGAVRVTVRVLYWAMAEDGNWALRQNAATTGDASTWLKLDKQRQRQTVWRWWVLGAGLVAAVVGTVLLERSPWWAQALAVAVAVPLLAVAGRPADKPITDRVTKGPAFRKLTAEMVRRALASIGLAGINQAVKNDPGAITFPQEIGRDGPGYRAVVDLPHGVDVASVIERRARLASGLRLPIDQVWPAPAGGHAGRLELWVGDLPASQMRQPAWPLLRDGRVNVFKPFPFATTPRLTTVNGGLFERNWLFGGVPGSGKTAAIRVVVLAAALDPRAQLLGYELKGTGDYATLEPLCSEYGSGAGDDTALAALDMLRWLHAECQRRAPVVADMAKAGRAPDYKVTPQLASAKDLGLHPIVAWIDECQELFGHPDKRIREEAGALAIRTIKLGRALGVIMVLGTQRPDALSLPTGITSQANTRFCLAVMDQQANDMILGTSAYKSGYRATAFDPDTDAGWGIAMGLGKPAPMRAFYIDDTGARRIVARATTYRQAAGTMPTGRRATGPGYDLLADIAAVWPAGEDKAWNETLLDLLAAMSPEVYGGWKPEQLTAALKPHGVDTGQILRRLDGQAVNRRGPARAQLDAVITERNRSRTLEPPP